MACECMARFNERLADHNTRIVEMISLSGNLTEALCTPHIEVEKIDAKKRGRAMGVIATFCPFCGVRYRQEAPASPPPAAPEALQK